ncbi:HEAT repeat domain-containing protein [Streptomyces stelliscabiei]|uniref:HEAT repeat domain-containing protein n=2 Tax=Streptomyces stelliscabiei TaxID=146820 RepID=UPI000AE66EE4|nr:HEAT repeat domain-containing protein [Streptomyces stelliscabiei]MDX2516500.1 HEAT repeat domain-containing protein [Streptomyces stelliscabiei]
MGVVRGGGAEGAAHQIGFFLRESTAEEAGRRAAAVKGLGRVGRWAAAYGEVIAGVGEAVVGAAQDPAAVVRAAAAHALGWLGPVGGDGAGAVVVALMGDADPAVRRRASLAAERLGLTGPDVVAALRRLSEDTDRHLRVNALLGLHARGETAEPELLVRLLGDTEPLVWGHARRALHASRDEGPVREQLLRAARHGHGLSRARALETLPARHRFELRDSLLAGLRDECPEVRRVVVGILADDPRHGTADALLSALRLSGPAAALHHALRRTGTAEPLLAVLRPSGTADAFLSALEAETDAEVAARLLRALGDRGDVRAVPAAVRWLDHPGSGPAAVRALAAIGTPTAVRWIGAVAVSGPGPDPGPGLGHPDVRATAATALGERAEPGATETLLPLLRDPDRRVRAGALAGLEHLGRHELPPPRRQTAAEALLGHLTTDEPNLRHTRNALTEYPETRPAVRRLIGHPSEEVRATVLSLLDEDDDEDVALFLSHLDDPSEDVRREALYGIGRHVDGCGELPAAPPGVDLLATLTALSRPPASRSVRYAAGQVLVALDRSGSP